MKTQKKAKYPLTVTVTPNPRPECRSLAGVEAKVKFAEGEAFISFVPSNLIDENLAATIRTALEERNIRDVNFEKSSVTGHLYVMWKGQSFPVAFSVKVSGPEYLYSRVKSALRERVSKEL
jgi:hypothetical protein